MKFHPELPNMLYTTSIDGTVACKDFEGRHGRVFLDTMDYNKWYTALAAPKFLNMLMVGSNTGTLILADRDGRQIWSGKPHKSKIHDLDVHPSNTNLFVTAGNDRVVKIFDLRKLNDNHSRSEHFVDSLEHEGVINSATFSQFAPFNLLTTSQNNECRVYCDISQNAAGSSSHESILLHPHRPFQHLTAIRADWHPVVPNIFTIGRYPSSETPQDRRTIDIFQYVNGGNNDGFNLIARLEDPRVGGIQCVSKMS